MSLSTEELYQLLPAIHRWRDREQVGDDPLRTGPLEGLFAVLAEQGRVLEDDLDRLYDNLFIETCDPWVVPYIGALLGVRGLHDTAAAGFGARALVANTLAYRRRKGTATVLEQLALDATGWRARAVEFFERLSATQYLNHLRPHALRTPDMRDTDALELVDTAFDSAAHTVDVRRIARGRGRHNIPNVGLFLWRLQSYALSGVTARPLDDGGVVERRGRYHVHPLGCDAPLFNHPQTETDILTLAAEVNVPGALRRLPLHRELEARRLALARGEAVVGRWFRTSPVFAIEYRLDPADPAFVRVAPEEMLIACLEPPDPAPPGVWIRPPTSLTYEDAAGDPVVQTIRVAVDPVHGRLAFPDGVVPAEVRVAAAHAFPGDVGGGRYDRSDSVDAFRPAEATWQAGVGRDVVEDAAVHLFNSLPAALAQWQAQPPGTTGIIALLDNARHAHAALSIPVPAGSRLLLVSADWPVEQHADGTTHRAPGRLLPRDRRAVIEGAITVEAATGGELVIDGLLVQGSLAVNNAGGAGLARLRLAHSTLVPAAGGLAIGAGSDALTVEMVRCISGPVTFAGPARALLATDSAIDAGAAAALTATEVARVEIESATICGTTQVRTLFAGNSIFTGPVTVDRQQEGCVRYCFVPEGSRLPRHYRCQPGLALADEETTETEAAILRRVVPDFTDEDYIDAAGRLAPAYLQLARSCPPEIATGAEDGSEMGLWRHLQQPQREANLRSALDEYLRLGLEAGTIFVT